MMPRAYFPVLMSSSKKDFDPYEDGDSVHLDVTDLAESHDQLGTVCDVHQCARFLDEAPIVYSEVRDGDTMLAKKDLFPHTWTSILSHTSAQGRHDQRRRTVTVRFCPACREAADRWFRAHLAA